MLPYSQDIEIPDDARDLRWKDEKDRRDDDRKAERRDDNDIQGAAFGTDDRTFRLRAERDCRAGRIYTVVYTATDRSGNQRTAAAQVIVPPDRRKPDR